MSVNPPDNGQPLEPVADRCAAASGGGWSWRAWSVLLFVLALATTLHLFYSAWCAMTWFKHGMADYGNYVNMIWNTGHGHPFKLRVDGSYLSYHLSFTLGILGLFYHLWNHAFLLALLQGLMVLGGAFLLVRAALNPDYSRSGIK